ncbi:MAG TPA: histidine phosphatase family protein [Candidatus Saccharimonadales bacterium]|nr:histidine phosphatase family protein [Candidatus Saccharimonadales bacterium]
MVEIGTPKRLIVLPNPFPNGESYEQTTQRMGNFLADLLRDYEGKRVMVIGHRATQYGLEHWVKGVTVKEAVTALWKWQPGWTYELKELPNVN